MGLFWKFLSGIFSIDDRDGNDNVTNGDFKLRSHSISFNLTNVGEFSGVKFQRTLSKIRKTKISQNSSAKPVL